MAFPLLNSKPGSKDGARGDARLRRGPVQLELPHRELCEERLELSAGGALLRGGRRR